MIGVVLVLLCVAALGAALFTMWLGWREHKAGADTNELRHSTEGGT